jgi:hypothetical protein
MSFTLFAGVAFPHRGASVCCCKTMLSEKIPGKTISENNGKVKNKKQARIVPFRIDLFFIFK